MLAKFVQLFALIIVLVPFLGVANLALAGQAPQTPPGTDGRSPTFTVSVASASARRMPSLSAPEARSVFAGQTFSLRARTADSHWLELASPGSKTGVWVLATWGTVSGGLDRLPVIGGAGAPLSPWETDQG